MIPMDACHVLLGRPWLFHRRVMHDGRMNTYSFVMDHKKITRALISPSQLLKPKEAPQKYIVLSFLLKIECHEFKPFKEWLLLGLEEIESNQHSHPLLIPLLQTFAHVFPQEIPHDLPP